MRWLHTYLTTLLAALASLTLCGCSDDGTHAPQPSRGVSLVISVAVSDAGKPGNGTRGDIYPAGEYPDGYEYGFEVPASQYENINTLRIIIVRPDNSVEHNRIESFTPHSPVSGEEYGDFVFKVDVDPASGREKKRIYLIANEADITPETDFTKYVAGATLTPGEAAGFLSYSEWAPGNVAGNTDLASPYIDNSGSRKRYVPMSEFFDVEVVRNPDAPDGVTTQTEKLFITRSLVKFAFQINVEGADDSSTANLGSFRVTNISFSNLMQKEYLFPNDTEYLPAKYPLSVSSPERIITSFSTPGFDGNTLRPYTFRPAGFGFPGKGPDRKDYKGGYVPMVYFCESRNNNEGNKFHLDLDVEFDDGNPSSGIPNTVRHYSGIELPNLPYFPRNTVVKVNLIFSRQSVGCTVDLVPYIGINLNPGFGFEELLPGDHSTPNWVN